MDISDFTEADVREEIIAPVLARLGYKSGTANHVRRELTLRYPKDFLGRKKPASDPSLRGRADYVCEVDSRIRWTIEAKPPTEPISTDDIEQAYTYAKHPEIRAPYFVVCNGLEFRVYATSASPEAGPLTTCDSRDNEVAVRQLSGLLAPDNLRMRFAQDAGPALPSIGLGLLSFAQIVGGETVIERSIPESPVFRGFMSAVRGGSIQRDDSGGLLAYLDTLVSHEALQRTNEKLGVARFEIRTADQFLSADATQPTTFEGVTDVVLPKGERILNLATWQEEQIPIELQCRVLTRGSGSLTNKEFTGRFSAVYGYQARLRGAQAPSMEVTGRVRLALS